MNKTTYNNWLVASDIDGTLFSKASTLPKRNKYAIERFMERGGYFTLASGRPVTSLERAYIKVHPNCPCIVQNGAGIFDYNEYKFIWKRTIGEKGRDFVRQTLKKYNKAFNTLNVGIFGADRVYITRAGVLSIGQMIYDRTAYVVTDIDNVPDDDWLKVVFWSDPATIARLKKDTDEAHEAGNFMLSSSFTIEMLEPGVHKGTAVMELAKMLNIEKQNVAAIGDYYNDWDMLKTVGLPACSGQAPQPIHDICKFEACHCNKGCVADLLNYIMVSPKTAIE